jgi:ribosomal protein S18 acetylase RimI-like enzyme
VPTPAWRLRPTTEDDRGFLFALHRETLREYVDAVWGWDEDDQRRRFDEGFDPGQMQIIVEDAADIGYVRVLHRPDELFLAAIELAPTWQNRGIGSAIVRSLLDDARCEGKPLGLGVLRSNPRALRLYERLGLVVVEEADTHFRMRSHE